MLRLKDGFVAIAWLLGGRSASMLLAFLTQALLAKALGTTGYGQFVGAFAAINLLTAVAQFGVASFWQRAFGKEGWRAQRWLGPSFSLLPFSVGVSLVIALTSGATSGFTFDSRGLVAWLWPLVAAQVGLALLTSKFQLEEQYLRVASLDLARQFLLFVAVAIAWHSDSGFQGVLGGFGAASLLLGSYSFWSLRSMRRGSFDLKGHDSQDFEKPNLIVAADSPEDLRFSDVARSSWPFAAVAIAFSIFFQSDLLLLGWLASPEDAAIYGATIAVLSGAYQLPFVIYAQFMLPKLHRWAEHDSAKFELAFRRGVVAMGGLGAFTAVAIALAGPALIDTFFGAEFGESSSLLRWMVIVLPVRFATAAVASTFVTVKLMRSRVLYIGSAAALNVGLNIALIPSMGYHGAAISTVAAETAVLGLYLIGSKRHKTTRGAGQSLIAATL